VPEPGGVTVIDVVAPTPGDGCVLAAADRVTCTPATLTGIVVGGGDALEKVLATARRY
jgi:hypothetical protein